MYKYFNLRNTNILNKGLIRNYQSNNVYGYKLKKKNSFQSKLNCCKCFDNYVIIFSIDTYMYI